MLSKPNHAMIASKCPFFSGILLSYHFCTEIFFFSPLNKFMRDKVPSAGMRQACLEKAVM